MCFSRTRCAAGAGLSRTRPRRFQPLPVGRPMLVQALALGGPVDPAGRFVGHGVAHPCDVVVGCQFGHEEHGGDAGTEQHDIEQAAEPARALALEVLLEGQVEADDAEHDPDDRDQEADGRQQASPDSCFVHRLAVVNCCPGTGDGDRQRPVTAQREQVIEQLLAVPGRSCCHVGSISMLQPAAELPPILQMVEHRCGDEKTARLSVRWRGRRSSAGSGGSDTSRPPVPAAVPIPARPWVRWGGAGSTGPADTSLRPCAHWPPAACCAS